MDLRSKGRNLSFEILSGSAFDDSPDGFHLSDSDPIRPFPGNDSPVPHPNDRSSRRRRKHKKKKPSPCSTISEEIPVPDDFRDTQSAFSGREDVFGNGVEFDCKSFSVGSGCTVSQVLETDGQNNVYGFGELRLRAVLNGGAEEVASGGGQSRPEESGLEVKQHGGEPNGAVPRKLETAESLDWKQLMTEDQNCVFPVEKSPVKYFMEEMQSGNSLRSTTSLGNEKERQRVYDTIFRLPWRCELLIDVGVFVCFDSFLSLLTIMPTRILVVLWKLICTRQLKKPSAAELSDIGCLVVLICGVTLLQWTDISLIYHMIRGQATVKLYVVYNVLEIFDKLCQSFGGDVLQTLFNSAEGLANCSPETASYWTWRFTCDLALAVASSIVHSFILLAQAITLSTCIVAHNNALLALLVSNNFAEIKSNVFKRFSKDNIHNIVYSDSVERFHISACVLFVLAQNIREAEGPWFESFLFNALLVYLCEIAIDVIKHSFIAKFNDIKPIAYSEFLEDLCKQTLNIQSNVKNSLTFVPLAPASVVIRVLTPVYAAHLPYNPLPWRLFWILVLFTMTYVMLASLKVMVRIGLQKHATWYVNRCQRRKLHSD